MQFSCPFPSCNQRKFLEFDFHSHITICYHSWCQSIGQTPLCVCDSCEGERPHNEQIDSGGKKRTLEEENIDDPNKKQKTQLSNPYEHLIHRITSSEDPQVILNSRNSYYFVG